MKKPWTLGDYARLRTEAKQAMEEAWEALLERNDLDAAQRALRLALCKVLRLAQGPDS